MSDEKPVKIEKPKEVDKKPQPPQGNNSNTPPVDTGSQVNTTKTSFVQHEGEYVDFSKNE